ncbi:MAG: type 1 glutamine amidotransferase [Chloroflexota bacterium]
MPLDLPISLCIINGYPLRSRIALDESGVSQAHDLYLNFLRRYVPNGRFDVLYVADLDVNLPSGTNLESYDGYIWTGSNLTIYHDTPEVTRQIELSRAIFESGKPQYGSCWGVQMAAVAAGGEVKKNPRGREWSIARDITLTPIGAYHPLYEEKPEKFDGFIMHLDEVTTIPAGGTLLATNKHTPVQGLEVRYPAGGVFWATQYHPEYTLYEMARLLVAHKKYLTEEGFFHEEAEVELLVDDMTTLSQNPDNPGLRQKLNIGDDILDDHIRQCELRNWLNHLVVPYMER